MSRRPDAQVYRGRVMHMRLQPVTHQFRYSVFSFLLNIDRLSETTAGLRLLGYNRFGVFSFYDADHGARDGTTLRAWADTKLAAEGIDPPHRIELLSFPRVLGLTFNPLSVYYCFDASDRMTSVIYEVKNTFGDQIAYVLPCDPAGGLQLHRHQKQMYVSPFIELEQTYRFALRNPGDKLSLRIRQAGQDGDVLIATHNGEAEAMSDKTLTRLFVAFPLMTLKVLAGIHFEAIRLFVKGVRFNRYSKSQIFAGKTNSG